MCGSDAKQIFLNGRRDKSADRQCCRSRTCSAMRRSPGDSMSGSCSTRGCHVALEASTLNVPPAPGAAIPPAATSPTGRFPAALHLGNCAAAPGAHTERFCAHRGQLLVVPAGMTDEAAVLADPASVSLRSILLQPPDPGLPALVYGSGTLAFAAIALLHHLYPGVEIWAACGPGPRGAVAIKIGADAVLPPEPDRLVDEVARRAGVRPLEPWSKHGWRRTEPKSSTTPSAVLRPWKRRCACSPPAAR